MIRVVLADDHNLVRAGLRALLEELPGVEVVAECENGREALAAVAALRPDVALLDIGMPGISGLDAAARLAGEVPETRVVMLSMHSSERFVARALSAGAAGYVLKEACVDELPLILAAVTRGETYLSPGISRPLVEALRARLAGGADLDPLTPRQREILQLLAEGKNTKEIGHLLGLSVKTVETHRAQIMSRLEIRDLPGLVRYAVRAGLVRADD
jgi:DNA-binding NarL/FixJ family response regulator